MSPTFSFTDAAGADAWANTAALVNAASAAAIKNRLIEISRETCNAANRLPSELAATRSAESRQSRELKILRMYQNRRATLANKVSDAATCWFVLYRCITFEVP